MTDCIDLIGNFDDLKTAAFKTHLGKAAALTILGLKDKYSEIHFPDDLDNIKVNPFACYETLSMALNPPKKGEDKYTYIGDKTTKNKDTGKPETQHDVAVNYKKFVIISNELKNTLTFLLNMYVNEVQQYYAHNKYNFGKIDSVLNNICEYTVKYIGESAITPCIVKINEVLNINGIIENNFNDINKNIGDKIRRYFKDSNDITPDAHVHVIVEAYVKFLKIFAKITADIILEKRQSLTESLIMGVLRIMSTMLYNQKCNISEDIFSNLSSFIRINKPKTDGKKKKKTETETNSDNEVDELNSEDEVEEKPKSRGKGKPKNTKNGNKPKKSKEPEPVNRDSESDVDDEIQNQLDEVDDEIDESAYAEEEFD